MERVTLSTLAQGAVEERFNDALELVIKNILDPNTDRKKARKISLTISMKPTKNESFTLCEIDVKTAIAPPVPLETGLVIGEDGKGKAVAAEYQNQVPGQAYIEEVDKETGEIKVVAFGGK